MGQLSKLLRDSEGNGLLFWCPGCDGAHRIQYGEGSGPRWGYNGNPDRPTFTPSILARWEEPKNRYNPEEMERDVERKRLDGTPIPMVNCVCHSFVTDGRIQFLGDSTHQLAGQTVDLPEWPNPEEWS